MVKSLNTKWKEFLFSFSGFGPNFLMVLMGAYFTDAINPSALGDNEFMRFASGACFILPALFPILYAIAKAFDGIIDIPFAHITDTQSNIHQLIGSRLIGHNRTSFLEIKKSPQA